MWQEAAKPKPEPTEWADVAAQVSRSVQGAIQDGVKAVGGAAEYAWPRYVRAVSVRGWCDVGIYAVVLIPLACAVLALSRVARRRYAEWVAGGCRQGEDGYAVAAVVATVISSVALFVVAVCAIVNAPASLCRAIEPEGAIVQQLVERVTR